MERSEKAAQAREDDEQSKGRGDGPVGRNLKDGCHCVDRALSLWSLGYRGLAGSEGIHTKCKICNKRAGRQYLVGSINGEFFMV